MLPILFLINDEYAPIVGASRWGSLSNGQVPRRIVSVDDFDIAFVLYIFRKQARGWVLNFSGIKGRRSAGSTFAFVIFCGEVVIFLRNKKYGEVAPLLGVFFTHGPYMLFSSDISLQGN